MIAVAHRLVDVVRWDEGVEHRDVRGDAERCDGVGRVPVLADERLCSRHRYEQGSLGDPDHGLRTLQISSAGYRRAQL